MTMDARVPVRVGDVPFAEADGALSWVLATEHHRDREVAYASERGGGVGEPTRAFGASRAGGRRLHCGVDCWASPGDLVLAPEGVRHRNNYHFYAGTHALICEADSGLTINFGEVEPGSWREFGFDVGDRMEPGQPVARVGRFNHRDAGMLHFEMYRPGVLWNQRWKPAREAPADLLNPTLYLLRAAAMPLTEEVLPLARGARGVVVRRLQQALAAALPRVDDDGRFGPITEDAVRAVQGIHGLAVTGVVDALTWDALTMGGD